MLFAFIRLLFSLHLTLFISPFTRCPACAVYLFKSRSQFIEGRSNGLPRCTHRQETNLAISLVDLTVRVSLSPTLSLSSVFREDEYLQHPAKLAWLVRTRVSYTIRAVNVSANVFKQNNGLLVYIFLSFFLSFYHYVERISTSIRLPMPPPPPCSAFHSVGTKVLQVFVNCKPYNFSSWLCDLLSILDDCNL